MCGRRLIYSLLVGLALMRACAWIATPAPAPFLPPGWRPDSGQDVVWVWGRVESLTRQGPKGLRFMFLAQGRWPGTPGAALPPPSPLWPSPVRVWVNWPIAPVEQMDLRVTPGDLWALPLRWRAAPPQRSSGSGESGFDTWRWMQIQGLAALATVPEAWVKGPRRLRAAPPGMQAWRQGVREAIFKAIAEPRSAGLVAALCMGDQNAIDPEDWPLFRATGVAHLVSISGLHVTLLAAWLASGVQWAWRGSHGAGRRWALWWPAPCVGSWVALVAAALYALFAGWGLPAQRTVWMLLATTALRLLGLHWPVHAVWLALIALIAWLDPLALSQPGFWLSYVAVGLLYGMGPTPAGSALRRWWHEGVSMQWRISLALAPMGLFFFQGFSLAGLWVNLWAIPWVTLVVTPLSLLGLLCPPLWTLAGWASGWLLAALAWAARSPWALIEVPAPPLAVVVLATGLAIAVAWPGPRLRRLGCALLLASVLAWR